MSSKLPRFIALCGHPKSGKSTAQKFLKDWGYDIADDGLPLRDFAVRHMGLTKSQVYTQEGKLETVQIAGRDWIVRDVLGQLGNAIEATFGDHAIPFMASIACSPVRKYSFGSVRRDQGKFWKSIGAVVVEIRNPLVGPSSYEFDRYDRDLVDYTIDNNGLARDMHAEDALADLKFKIDHLMLRLAQENEKALAA